MAYGISYIPNGISYSPWGGLLNGSNNDDMPESPSRENLAMYDAPAHQVFTQMLTARS